MITKLEVKLFETLAKVVGRTNTLVVFKKVYRTYYWIKYFTRIHILNFQTICLKASYTRLQILNRVLEFLGGYK